LSAPPDALSPPPAARALDARALRRIGVAAVLALFTAIALVVRWHEFYTPRRGFGYWLGATGGTLMLLLLTYPLRKRIAFMESWGPLKHWFRMHMTFGVLGPVFVLFHSGFHVGSLNAGIAMGCMLLVMSSGFVGRFLYREIHHGLYGSRLNLKELEQQLAADLKALDPMLAGLPAVKQELERFAALVSHRPKGFLPSAGHFLSLGAQRIAARRRVRRVAADGGAAIAGLLDRIDATLRVVQRTAQFTTYERLFSIWHAVHIPFLAMLVLTAVIHVVAVHFY
jgi:hypothetical protein